MTLSDVHLVYLASANDSPRVHLIPRETPGVRVGGNTVGMAIWAWEKTWEVAGSIDASVHQKGALLNYKHYSIPNNFNDES